MPDGVEDRRHEVDAWQNCSRTSPRCGDAVRPVHDQRRAHATEPRVALPQAQRRVARPRPSPRVVVVRTEAAESSMRARFSSRSSSMPCMKRCSFTDRTVPLRRWRRCRTAADQGVVEQVVRAQVLEHAPDLVIGVARGSRRTPPSCARRGAARRRRARPTPGPTAGAAVSTVSGGHDARATWRERAFAPRSQPPSNCPRYGSIHSGGDLVRRVHRAGREPHEERLARRGLLLVRTSGSPGRRGPR